MGVDLLVADSLQPDRYLSSSVQTTLVDKITYTEIVQYTHFGRLRYMTVSLRLLQYIPFWYMTTAVQCRRSD